MKNIGSYIMSTIRENGNLFTIFAAILIIFTGVAIVDNKDNWWLSGVSVIVFFFVVFIFMNARVVIKSTLSILFTVIMSVLAFQFGTIYDPVSSAGFIWMFQILFSYFAMIALSYLFQSYKSRWGVATISLLFGAAITSICMISSLNSIVSILAGTISALAIFTFSFILSVKVFKGVFSFKSDAMPENSKTTDILKKLQSVIEKEGNEEGNISRVVSLGDTLTDKQSEKLKKRQIAKARKSLKKDKLPINDRNIESRIPEDDSPILAYGEYAYLIRPVNMKTYFYEKGRKNKRLTYRNRNIVSWILSKYYNELPTWKTGNAPVMMVLLDVNNSNGKEVKVIGVGLPDSNKRLPVAVIPGKGIEHNDRSLKSARKIIADINELNKYNQEIEEKEKDLLDLIGKTE